VPGSGEELKLLRENNTPWDEKTYDSAALGGHLEVLQWARANGCTWNWKTCVKVAERGRREAIQKEQYARYAEERRERNGEVYTDARKREVIGDHASLQTRLLANGEPSEGESSSSSL